MIIPSYPLKASKSTVVYRGGVIGIIPFAPPQPAPPMTTKELLAKRAELLERSHELRRKCEPGDAAIFTDGRVIEEQLVDVETKLSQTR